MNLVISIVLFIIGAVILWDSLSNHYHKEARPLLHFGEGALAFGIMIVATYFFYR